MVQPWRKERDTGDNAKRKIGEPGIYNGTPYPGLRSLEAEREKFENDPQGWSEKGDEARIGEPPCFGHWNVDLRSEHGYDEGVIDWIFVSILYIDV